jgi:hypothetical protein
MFRHNRYSVAGLLLVASAMSFGCGSTADSHPERTSSTAYVWTKVTDHGDFPESYNFPMFNIGGKLRVFCDTGNWYSDDGRRWTKADLPALGLRTGYQQYVQFNDAIYALGSMEGNYQNLKLGSRIARTTSDFKRWEVMAENSQLPARVFYGATVFAGKIWLFGGFDGTNYYNDVWSSSDAIKWQHVSDKAPWSPRSNPTAIVFKNQIWLMAGGIIDGEMFNDVWRSSDGVNWTRVTERIADKPVFGFSAVVYEEKLWLVGLNRNDGFRNAVLVSSDGVSWEEQRTPWTPRGGVATCVRDNKLFMTGGKYSVARDGRQVFIYSNDVWYLATPPK